MVASSLYNFALDSPARMLAVPFVLLRIFRYLLLIHRRDVGEEPENVLLSDVPTLVTVAAWALTAAAILALA